MFERSGSHQGSPTFLVTRIQLRPILQQVFCNVDDNVFGRRHQGCRTIGQPVIHVKAFFHQCFDQLQAFPINGMEQETAIVLVLVRRFQHVARTNHRQGFVNVVFIPYESKEFFHKKYLLTN